jgi:hypothetical protein
MDQQIANSISKVDNWLAGNCIDGSTLLLLAIAPHREGFMNRFIAWAAGPVLFATLVVGGGARAGFIDFDDQLPGAQTASWPEPTAIMVFIPAGLNGANRMNFEMGINALVMCLKKITVQFKDGEPPTGAMNAVDVNLKNMNPPPFGLTQPAAVHQPGQNHGTITGATMDIDPMSLTQGANFMKNLGAHEFGHALGLEEDPRQSGQRTNVMDPDFNMNDPFVAPSKRDKMMLMEHYAVVPEPGSLPLAWMGFTAALMCAGRTSARGLTASV